MAYASRALTENERNYAQIEKELLALVYCQKKNYHYTYGNFDQTDHKPLTAVVRNNLVQTTSRLQRMFLKLDKFQFTVVYVPGKEIFIADTLSRTFMMDKVEDDPELQVVVHTIYKHLAITPMKQQVVTEEIGKDSALRHVKILGHNGWPEKSAIPDYVSPC